MNVRALEIPAVAADGHRSLLQARIPGAPTATLFWPPGTGTAARHLPRLAGAAPERGNPGLLDHWRGLRSSTPRRGAGR